MCKRLCWHGVRTTSHSRFASCLLACSALTVLLWSSCICRTAVCARRLCSTRSRARAPRATAARLAQPMLMNAPATRAWFVSRTRFAYPTLSCARFLTVCSRVACLCAVLLLCLQNGGTCTTPSVNSFSCDCASTGYSGPTCSVDVDECASSPCEVPSRCACLHCCCHICLCVVAAHTYTLTFAYHC